jgi:hypothetical protein
MAQVKIYSITSDQTPSVYIGSTKSSLTSRLYQHKKALKSFENGDRSSMSSFDLVKHTDAKINLIKECKLEERDHEEKVAQDSTQNCCNIRDPTIYKTTKPMKRNGQDTFTDEQVDKISNSPTKNSEYVLRNYYRYKDEKLKYHALKRVRNTGLLPRASTIDKYKITSDEIIQAVRIFQTK